MEAQKEQFVFFGTSKLGALVLEELIRAGYIPSAVVVAPDKPAGRKQIPLPSPVKVAAQEHGLNLLQPERVAGILQDKSIQKAEFIVLAAYGRILPKELVELPPKGALNVHPSLLPKYRGPSPVQGAILNGEEKTGVTVMLMDEEIDHGLILAQKEIAIPPDIRQPELHEMLGKLGGTLLCDVLPRWLEGTLIPIPQDHQMATYTKHISREDGRIDWNEPAAAIERKIRAYDPWPGVFTFAGRLRIKILDAELQEDTEGLPGETFLAQGKLGVYTGKGSLVIGKLQVEGKKPVLAREFLLGHPNFPGTRFAS